MIFLYCLALILCLLSASIIFVLFAQPLYTMVITYLSIPSQIGLSVEQILRNYQAVLHYVSLPWVNKLTMPNFTSSPAGLLHFYEVKQLFLINDAIFIISLLVVIWAGKQLKKQQNTFYLLQFLKMLQLAPLISIIALIMFFDPIFTTFHKLLFNNDAWLFDPRFDPVINILPEPFFMACFVMCFICLQVGLGFVYFIWRRQSRLKP